MMITKGEGAGKRDSDTAVIKKQGSQKEKKAGPRLQKRASFTLEPVLLSHGLLTFGATLACDFRVWWFNILDGITRGVFWG